MHLLAAAAAMTSGSHSNLHCHISCCFSLFCDTQPPKLHVMRRRWASTTSSAWRTWCTRSSQWAPTSRQPPTSCGPSSCRRPRCAPCFVGLRKHVWELYDQHTQGLPGSTGLPAMYVCISAMPDEVLALLQGGIDKKRLHFIEGGQAGNREVYINNLIRVMN